ncbi:MAG: hypothetical protein MUO62_12520 [Anaerolineales bacterium]|nr:hypothetical protein [Anaerolineales bacterium]
MNTADERMMILKMIEDGTVSADEGARLLSSVDKNTERLPMKSSPRPTGSGKWFRVRVTDTRTGKTKATVSLPMALMDWGLRVGAQFAPEVANIDLQELSDILKQGMEGKIVDVLDEEDGEHVEIFID